MSQDDIEELRRELDQLKIITSNLRRDNIVLRESNRTLVTRVQNLERSSNVRETNHQVTAIDSQGNIISVGDSIRIESPTCPGRNRHIIPEDSEARITRTSGDWVCFTCTSGVSTKRYPCNVTLIQNDDHRET